MTPEIGQLKSNFVDNSNYENNLISNDFSLKEESKSSNIIDEKDKNSKNKQKPEEKNNKTKEINEILDEESVIIESHNKSTSGRIGGRKNIEILNEDKKDYFFDLIQDPDFLASLATEQLLKFTDLRNRIREKDQNLEAITNEILSSDFINSLNGLQYNTFVVKSLV